jgi:flavin reductase (DIM6/NTAB) family NADH-FMN oxidoreductase RutF
MLGPDETYQLLRTLTSPVVAITSAHGGTRNGMIIDSAIRASIVPTVPRLAIFIHKFNFSHDLVFGSGHFALHLLRTDQYGLIHHLGFQSRRDVDKLATVAHGTGVTGAPVLDDCFAHFECRVINAMDTGSSTCFLGDVVDVGFGAADGPRGDVLTAAHFREHIPEAWREDYARRLAVAQREAERAAGEVRAIVWRDLREPGAGSREP